MSKPETIKLALTEEELLLIEDALWTESFNLKEDINQGEEFSDNEYFCEMAERAKSRLPKVEAIRRKVFEERCILANWEVNHYDAQSQ